MASILGVEFYEHNMEKVGDEIIYDIVSLRQKANNLISASNAHSLVHAYRNPAFKKILNEYTLNLPDGMPIVWISRLKGVKGIKRCYGPDFFEYVIRQSANQPVKHFLCGGNPGVAQELKLVCETKLSNFKIVGHFSPPFREITNSEIAALGHIINESGANIIWIALGAPKQEEFAYRLKQYVNVHYLIPVGAAFDFHTGRVKQAPKWVQNLGFEWLFRLLMEPKRLSKRYITVIPLFIFYNIKEWMAWKTNHVFN